MSSSNINPYERDFEYYKNIDKVFWVPVKDILLPNGNIIKQNTPTPCIYVQDNHDHYSILQFDMSLENDKWRYTAWISYVVAILKDKVF